MKLTEVCCMALQEWGAIFDCQQLQHERLAVF